MEVFHLMERAYPKREVSREKHNVFLVDGVKIYALSSKEHSSSSYLYYWFTFLTSLLEESDKLCLFATNAGVYFEIDKECIKRLAYFKGNKHGRNFIEVHTDDKGTHFNLVGKKGKSLSITPNRIGLSNYGE
ncbi:hypothetical protein [Falsibacillus pallidus]|uniref:hypothetical protein n=1 Tax=Falsibacillus pallidus TaxID=493781 RepID=UPI003D957289